MYIQLNGQILYYEKTGEGKPLILLHGNSETHAIFDALTKELEEEFLIYAIDTRGHGESATPKEYHYADMAKDLELFIASLEIDHPIVLGFSDGAIIAMLYAMGHSDLLSGLILCGANLTPKGLKKKAQREIKKICKNSPSPLTQMMLVEPNINPSELANIHVPTYVCCGENDLIKDKETDNIVASIPGAKKYSFKGEDHGSYVVDSTKLAPIVREIAK